MKKTILLTGGAGFIGSHVARSVLANPLLSHYRLIVLDDLSGGFRENVPRDPRVEFVLGSITDEKLMDRLFQRHRFAYVYHLAAYAAEGLSHFIRKFNYTNNLLGSVNLINAAVNYGTDCFVFTSSIAVYGAGQVPMREDMVPQPEDPYGISKCAVELDLKAAHDFFGLNYVIFRPHNVYGEYQNIGDRYRNVVGIFMNQILQGKPMTIFGDGSQQRAFTYIGDIAPIIASSPLVDKGKNRIFNIGADQPCSVGCLAHEVAKAMGAPPQIVHLPPRTEVALAYSDHSAVTAILGDTKQTSLEEGLHRMAGWVKTIGSRKSKNFEKIEINRNLPPSWVGTVRKKIVSAAGTP
jgi:UDP-glucose 4-epimerase